MCVFAHLVRVDFRQGCDFSHIWVQPATVPPRRLHPLSPIGGLAVPEPPWNLKPEALLPRSRALGVVNADAGPAAPKDSATARSTPSAGAITRSSGPRLSNSLLYDADRAIAVAAGAVCVPSRCCAA